MVNFIGRMNLMNIKNMLYVTAIASFVISINASQEQKKSFLQQEYNKAIGERFKYAQSNEKKYNYFHFKAMLLRGLENNTNENDNDYVEKVLANFEINKKDVSTNNYFYPSQHNPAIKECELLIADIKHNKTLDIKDHQ